jgi:hypothetical protein
MRFRDFPIMRLACVSAIVGLVLLSQTGACVCTPCPDQEPFESGRYEVVGLNGRTEPESQWLIDTVIGAQLTVDRETGEATIRYTKDGTTYEVQYTIEGSQP